MAIRNLKKTLTLTGLLFISTFQSCTPPVLNAHTDYISEQNLASYWVDTPDPLLNYPPYGQRLFIDWAIPLKWQVLSDKVIRTTIHFRNGTNEAFELPIKKNRGTYTYFVLNEQYSETRGILSYKVELFASDTLLTDWKHQIWVERLCLSEK